MTNLQNAFRRFEDAALSLQKTHDRLQGRVDQLELQLVDAHRRLEAVVEAIDTGIAVIGAGGELLRTNGAFRAMGLDLEAHGLLGADPRRGESTRLTVETGAGPRDLIATVVPVGDWDATRVLTFQDMTEVRREEEEGGRRQRLEALGRMAAELAHEVRNPLGGIRLFAAMLRDDLDDRPEQQEMAEQILAAGSGLETTVTNLLAFASPSGGEIKPTDVAALARETLTMLAPACAVRGVTLTGPADDLCHEIQADPESMRQILLNLVGNALAATADGGSIRIELAERDPDVTMTVIDDGRGIAAEDLPRVFDPFFTRTEGGTGLGLSIVHRIVERHGGKVHVDSRPGDGTRVTVELPRVAREVKTEEIVHA